MVLGVATATDNCDENIDIELAEIQLGECPGVEAREGQVVQRVPASLTDHGFGFDHDPVHAHAPNAVTTENDVQSSRR